MRASGFRSIQMPRPTWRLAGDRRPQCPIGCRQRKGTNLSNSSNRRRIQTLADQPDRRTIGARSAINAQQTTTTINARVRVNACATKPINGGPARGPAYPVDATAAMATRGARDLDRPAALKSVGTTLARPRPIKPNPPTASAGRPTSKVAVMPRAARAPPLRNSCVAPRRLVSQSPLKRPTAIATEKAANAVAAKAASAPSDLWRYRALQSPLAPSARRLQKAMSPSAAIGKDTPLTRRRTPGGLLAVCGGADGSHWCAATAAAPRTSAGQSARSNGAMPSAANAPLV